MIPKIGYGEALHRLCHILLGAERAAGTANRRNDLRYERKVNGVYRYISIDCSSVRRGRIVHRIIVRVETERNVIGNPEDSVAAASHSLGIVAVGTTDAGRHIRSVERNRGPAGWTDQKHIAAQPRQARYIGQAGGGRIRKPALGGWVEIRLTVEPLGPGPLQIVPKAEIQLQLVGKA